MNALQHHGLTLLAALALAALGAPLLFIADWLRKRRLARG